MKLQIKEFPTRYHPDLILPPSLTASVTIAFVYLIPVMILGVTFLYSLRLFFSTLRQLSLEEICRGLIFELTTLSIWGGLGRRGSRGLQLGVAVYYLLANGHYVISLYYNFYSRLQAGEGLTLWQNLLLGEAFPVYCIVILACGIASFILALFQIILV